MHEYNTAGIGEVLWDFFTDGKKWGGAPGNFARHCAKLGCRASIVSAVGDDTFGRELVADARAAGLECIVPVADYPTGTVMVHLDDAGVPEYEITEDVAWDHIPLTDEMVACAKKLDAVCFGSLAQRYAVSRKTIGDFLACTGPDCLKICDINLRQHYHSKEIIDDCLRRADLLKVNDEEFSAVAATLGYDGGEENSCPTARRMITDYSLRWVVVTRGRRGSAIIGADDDWSCEGFPTDVVDTVGAGDAFTASMAVGLLDGIDPGVVNRAACRIAAFVCSRPGAVPELPEQLIPRKSTTHQ